MPHHERSVDTELGLDRSEVLVGRAPVPWHALAQRLDRHTLDPCQHPQQVLGVGRFARQWLNTETAIPGERSRDAVERRRCQRPVPEDLRVEVRMDVDETRRHHLAAGVDDGGRLRVELADRHHAVVLDADVRPSTGCPRPVDEIAASDDQIKHGPSLSGCAETMCRDNETALVVHGPPCGPRSGDRTWTSRPLPH